MPDHDPLEGPVSPRASKLAMEFTSKFLDEIAEDPEWEKMIGLVVGNLMGHGTIMIERHLGKDAATRWIQMVERVVAQHVTRSQGRKKEGPEP